MKYYAAIKNCGMEELLWIMFPTNMHIIIDTGKMKAVQKDE